MLPIVLKATGLMLALAMRVTTVMVAAPEYTTIRMEITVNKSAADTWAKVGSYCDLGKWLATGRTVPCAVTSGDGEMGSVRSLNNGAVLEIMTAKTDLSYGYAQPIKDGQFYNLYHGFLEAKPITATTSRLIYTLLYDASNLADQNAKDADAARRRKQFEAALVNMKTIAEAP
ncbi:MAG: hypothetical protein ABI120_08245 [Gemmatimonadaceae bacterium]